MIIRIVFTSTSVLVRMIIVLNLGLDRAGLTTITPRGQQ
jgi:hypothetical protein